MDSLRKNVVLSRKACQNNIYSWSLIGGMLVALICLPMVIKNQYIMNVLIIAFLYVFYALAWNIVGGIAGQLSLGHSAYAGIGAYTSTVLFIKLGISPWIGMFVGCLFSAIGAIIIGYPCFKLRGAYYALATLSAAMILKSVVENTHDLLGGPRGLGVTFLKDAPLYFQDTNKLFYYVTILVFIVIIVLISWWIIGSKMGFYLNAIKNDQDAAQSLGINITKYKLIAAVISAVFTSMGGTFYAQLVLYINPDKILGTHLSIELAIMCIIGGRGTIIGPILGAFLLVASQEITHNLLGQKMIGSDLIVYGLVLMGVIRYQPEGIYKFLRKLVWDRKSHHKVSQNFVENR